jgi:hypothetical protein
LCWLKTNQKLSKSQNLKEKLALMTYTTVYIWLNAILDDDIIKNTRPFQSVIIQLTKKISTGE